LKALRFSKTGDLKYLEYVECPTPSPAHGEVLIEIKAARLNKNDISNVMGKLPYTTVPRTPGRDFSGVVVQGPKELVGRAVWGTGKEIGFTRDGSHAQYLTLAADAVAIKPESLSFAQAASCGVPYVTAWHALEGTAVNRGCKLLILGAAGAVGNAAVMLARWRGAEILGAERNAELASSLASQGVLSIVLASEPSGKGELAQAIQEKFPGGADVIFDTTGLWLPESVRALGNFGRIAVIVAPGNGEITVPIRDLYRRGGAIVGVNSLLYSSTECAQLMAAIGKGFDSGELHGPQGLEEHPLAAGTQMYEALSKGRSAKIVFIN
jgi:NADPH:quinone reductase-like Zn-dependent oxidoreductase